MKRPTSPSRLRFFRVVWLFALTLLSGFTHASPRVDFPISGRIIDQDKKPVPYAVVTLLKAEDSTLVKGLIADDAGNFSFDNVNAGKYLIAVSFTGFSKTFQGPFDLAADQKLVLPDITLLPAKDLEAVDIVSMQPLYVQKPDMIIMNVENSPVRIIGTAWDLISTAPGVVVDQNGKVTLRGKSGVLIYVDNKNTFLGGDQLMNYLQGISAADVVSIQIIPNPPAKYDAQGSGGIINIITRKGSQQGLNGSVRAGYGQAFYSKFDGGLNFNYAKEKFNIYGKYDTGNPEYLERAYINRNVTYNGITTNFNQHSSTIGISHSNNAKLGVDFYAKHNITWGARVDGSFNNGNENAVNSTLISQAANDTTSELYQKNSNKSRFKNGAVNLYYDQKIDTNGRELSGSIDLINYQNDDLQNFNLNYFDQAGNIFAPSENQRSDALSTISILVGQVDYAHPFRKKYKLETGLKSSYVQTSNDLKFDVLNNQIWENDTTRSNKFIYTEQINAAYANGYATFGKWQFEAGLRVEQTLSEGNSPTTGQDLKNSYIQLFPSVFILDQLNKKNALNFTYARRVNRPGYENLNPFIFYLDKYTYEEGNPFLQPEISNNMDLTYSFMDALFVTTGIGRTKNAMTDVTNQVDSTGIGYKTTVNLNNVDNAYFGISSPIPIGNALMIELELNEAYNKFASNLYNTNFVNKSWMFNGSTTITLTLPHTLKFQVWAWYQSPGTYGIFHMLAKEGCGASISKTFLHKQLSVNLVANDIFHTTGMRSTINFQGQDVYLKFEPETPRVSLRVRYSFGNNKATRKAQDKSGADDLKNRTGK
ncbi:MAG TPA: outer membrane beta-barrel protein [Bacteroidia bacterium]|nr:outer membrane beta-barrel protein [Bacteroidia bacterium]